VGGWRKPIEKINEFGFVLQMLQLLIESRDIYKLLSFIKSLNGNPAPE